MNFKTTIALAVLTVVGGLIWLIVPSQRRAAASSDSLAVLENQLKPDRLNRIEVTVDGRTVVLERAQGGEWTLPGNWPTRQAEADRLVRTLTSLQSRFAPIPLTNPPDLSAYGLSKPAVTIDLTAQDKNYHLQLGEEPGDTNRFSSPTFLRIDENNEVVRLAPGLVSEFRHPFGFYQQHRLFPAEANKEGEDKTERLLAKSIVAVEKKPDPTNFTLAKVGDDWQLQDPVKDVPDPDKLKAILTAVPDIWAVKFYENSDKDLANYGLKEPEQTIQITKTNGEKMTLLIGKQSRVERRTILKPSPPFGPPQPPKPETIEDKYRFAKLKDNDQIFDFHEDKLKDIFLPLKTLRDARLARFSSFDAQRLEINHDGQDILLEKDKSGWKLKKPVEADAEGSKVTELLDKLSNLESRDQDVIDKGDAKNYGLDKPAGTIQVKIEESKGEGEKKTTKTKNYKFILGKRDKAKLYVRMDGLDRINAVEDSVWKLVDRPVLTYRNKRVLDFMTGDLAKIDIQRGAEKFTLEQVKDSWQLTSPVKVEADQAAANKLAGDLGRMDVTDYVANDAKKEDLDKLYGLAKPEVSATVSFTTKDKKPQTLEIGKQRGDKPEFFAKLDSSPAVFVVKKELHDALEQNSLAYRPKQLWNIKADDITELHLQKEGQNEQLKRDGAAWRIVEPFQAAALPNQVDKIVKALTAPNCVRFEAHVAKELKTYGLDKPYLRVAVTSSEAKSKLGPEAVEKKEGEKKDDQIQKEKPKEHVMLIGQPTSAGAPTRFAKLGDAEAIFVVDQSLAGPLDQSPLDLLDRVLLRLNSQNIQRIQSTIGGTALTIQRDKEAWRVQSAATQFTADKEVLDELLKVFSNLQAEKFAAYGSQVNPATFGFDKPTASITVSAEEKAAATDKNPAKKQEHTLILGKPVDKDSKVRYARLDNGPGVAILSASAVTELTRPYLDYMDRNLFQFDTAAVTGLEIKSDKAELVIAKREDGWQIVKPAPHRADDPTIEQLLEQLSRLRAKGVAAYPAKDLKEFGLDKPEKVLTVRMGNKTSVLNIGKATEMIHNQESISPAHYAQVNGSNIVAILDGATANRLTTEPLSYRDRMIARFADADKAILERGPRKAVFAKVDGTWKLTEPITAEAEQTELDDLVNALARLRANNLEEEKPSDLKRFGLDKPTAHWRFLSGDQDVLDLLIGDLSKQNNGTGAERYAKLAKGDLVFTLDASLSQKLLAEYRSRTVWTGLDSAQVDRITFGYAQNPFELEKVDNIWHVADKPSVPLKSERITETLDTLSRLKVERFVADNKADLKLYGLEPPQLVLDIQTPSGKKTLHVGRAEGNTKKYYARVPEPNRSDVFILSEADAAKILRTIADFGK
jgi:hypothetical protein